MHKNDFKKKLVYSLALPNFVVLQKLNDNADKG
jgi:hypothetical protein